MLDIHYTNMPAFVVTLREDGFYFQDANAAFLAFRNQDGKDLIDQRVADCGPAALGEKLLSHYSACAESNAPQVYDVEYVLGSGACYWQTTLVPFAPPGAKRADTMLGFCLDRTEDWLARRASEELNQVLSAVMRSVQGGFWIYDIATDSFEISASLAELVTGGECSTLSFDEYLRFVDADDLLLKSELVPPPEGHTVDFRICGANCETRWLQSRRHLICGQDGVPLRVIAFVTDVTEYKSKLTSLQEEAYTDALTGLQNRRAFDKMWTETFDLARIASASVGLILLDVDGLKPINDRYGHLTGDLILKSVGERIARQARKSDHVTRIGGDEFAIILRNPSPQCLDSAARRLRQIFETPIEIEGRSIVVGVSAGTALVTSADGSTADAFGRADQDLYAKKAALKCEQRRFG